MHQPRVLWRFRQQITPPAEMHGQGHHQLLANRVDGRIGYLRKELLEVGVKQSRLQGKDGEGSVISHRANGFRCILDHGLEDHLQLLAGISEAELLLSQG